MAAIRSRPAARRPLDYGHWSAHKLEALTAHELRHGEAVAIGIALDTRYSVQIGMLPAGAEERVLRCSSDSASICGIRRWSGATTTAAGWCWTASRSSASIWAAS